MRPTPTAPLLVDLELASRLEEFTNGLRNYVFWLYRRRRELDLDSMIKAPREIGGRQRFQGTSAR